MAEIRVSVLNQVVRVVTIGQQGPPGPSKYLSYVICCSQSGGNAPTFVLQGVNEISTTDWGTFSYLGEGHFLLTFTEPLLVAERAVVFVSNGLPDEKSGVVYVSFTVDETGLEIKTNDFAGDPGNGVLQKCYIEIRIYPSQE
jgi:hypothetical protein